MAGLLQLQRDVYRKLWLGGVWLWLEAAWAG